MGATQDVAERMGALDNVERARGGLLGRVGSEVPSLADRNVGAWSGAAVGIGGFASEAG